MHISPLPPIFSPVDTYMTRLFDSHIHPEPNSGCWIWTGGAFRLRNGYGSFTCREAGLNMKRAHRVAWTIFRGDIPLGAHVLHRCDNPACVNPAHLFLGDQRSNMQDKARKGRQNRGDNHNFAKLSEEQAVAILRDTRPIAEVAEEFGISQSTVRDIKSRRSWRHIVVA